MVGGSFVIYVIDRSNTGLTEVDPKFLHSKGLLVANALVCPERGTVPARLANPNSQRNKLKKKKKDKKKKTTNKQTKKKKKKKNNKKHTKKTPLLALMSTWILKTFSR